VTRFCPSTGTRALTAGRYEAYCFWRWGVVEAYLRGLAKGHLQVSRVYTLGRRRRAFPPERAMANPKTRPGLWEEHRPGKYGARGRHLRTPGELTAYWKFIQGLYASNERTEWFVRNFGNETVCTERVEVIPCSGTTALHVSDMHALFAFLDASPKTRTSLNAGEWLFGVERPC